MTTVFRLPEEPPVGTIPWRVTLGTVIVDSAGRTVASAYRKDDPVEAQRLAQRIVDAVNAREVT